MHVVNHDKVERLKIISRLYKGLLVLIPLLYLLDIIRYGPFELMLWSFSMGEMRIPPATDAPGFCIRLVSLFMYGCFFKCLHQLNERDIEIETCGGWDAWVVSREDSFWESLKPCGELVGLCGSGENCTMVETTEGFYRIQDHIDDVKKGVPVYTNWSSVVIGARGDHSVYTRTSE